jgi:hypothetical protein
LRNGADFATIQELVRTGMYNKPWGHDLPHGVYPQKRFMVHIGG